MNLGICLLLLAVTVVCARRYRSGYDCRRYCGYSYNPVCSSNNERYDNECMLKCDWAYKACNGECPCRRAAPRRVIPIVYQQDPAPVYYTEPAQGDCYCGNDKDYVCTTDGDTYDNKCEAKCEGKVVACDNACPC